MPLNILITAFGSAGDVLPLIGVGAELRKRGHEVTLVSNPHFEPRAAEAGMAFSPVGSVAGYHELMNDAGLFDWRTAGDRVLALFAHIVEPVYETVMRLHQPGRTVILTGAQGSWIAQEKCYIPVAQIVVAPSRLPSRHDPPHPPRPLVPWAARLAKSRRGIRFLYGLRLGLDRLSAAGRSKAPSAPAANPFLDEMNRVRARLELPLFDASSALQFPPERIVCMWPDWFAERQSDWPPEAMVAGFPFYPEPPPTGEGAPGRPDGGADRNLLVFTTGSVASRQEAFFASAVEACRILQRPGILVTPHGDQLPRPLPTRVTHLTHAPFGELFARAALVVHHGGIGTMALALAAGIPQVVRPMMGEQFDLGNRLQRLGVGRMIDDRFAAPGPLAKVIDALLRSERVAKRCRHWQARIDRLGLTHAADAVDSLAASSRLPLAAG